MDGSVSLIRSLPRFSDVEVNSEFAERKSMGRQLVVCLDGTNNRFSHRPTNVIHVLRSLNRDPTAVLAYYDQGVGTFGIKEALFEWQKVPSRVFGLAFGWGLDRTVANAYQFLASTYADGDEIFLFGFSRGAYAVRVLAALIRGAGLVAGYQGNLFEYAWSILKRRKKQDDSLDFELQDRFKATFGRKVRVHFLGVFDTVSSVGWIYDPFSFPYTMNNDIVDFVRHAVCLDEKRCFFRSNLWSAQPDPPTKLKEVWFAGVHSDIGGGYAPDDSRLTRVALRWMLAEAVACGLRIDDVRAAHENGPASDIPGDWIALPHDSMTTGWKCAEWVPRRVWDSTEKRKRWFWGRMPPFRRPLPRKIPEGALIHRSVETRIARQPDYQHPKFPDCYTYVDDEPLNF
jgi:uncharacterized protein (DUF2235 family)